MFNQTITNELENRATADLKEGDIIFISIGFYPFTQVAHGTGSWCSHVGFVVREDNQWYVLESAVPFVKKTPLRKFIQRTANYDLAVRRLPRNLSEHDIDALKASANKQMGRLYHTGFKFESKRQFCSKFVHQIFAEALSVKLGRVQTLKELIDENPQANLSFWKTWYFGRIPWERKTITPNSQLKDPQLVTVLDMHQEKAMSYAS